MKEYLLECSYGLLGGRVGDRWGKGIEREISKKKIEQKITFQVWEVWSVFLINKTMADWFHFVFWDTIYCCSHIY